MSLRASMVYTASRALAGGMTMLAMALLARTLGPADYGWYALAATAALLSVAVLLQPFQQVLTRFLAGDPAVAPCSARVMIGLIVLAGVVAGGVELVLHFFSLPYQGLAAAAWLLGTAQYAFEYSAQHASASLQPARYAWLYLVKAGLMLLGIVCLWLFGRGVWGGVLAVAAAGALALGLFGRDAWRNWWSVSLQPAMRQRLWQFCLPVGGTMLLGNALVAIDRVVLGVFGGAAAIGAYAALYDIVQLSLGFLCGSLFLAWYPRIVAAHEQGDAAERSRLADRYLALCLVVMWPATIGLGFLGADIVAVLYGPAYMEAGHAIWWPVCVAAMLACLRIYLFDIGLFLSGRMVLQLRNVAMCAALLLVFTVLAVPRWGMAGAAWAVVLVQGCGVLLSAHAARKVVGWRLAWPDVWKTLFASFLMIACLTLWPRHGVTSLILAIVSAAALYSASLVVMDGAGARTWLRQAWRARKGLST